MKISGWMHMRVLARAAKARLLRAAGRPDRPVERHPDGMQLQPSDLGSVRARAAPLQLARMNGAFSNARAWQEAARAKLRELLVVEQGDHVANESWSRDIGEVLARRVYVRRTAGVDIPVTVLSDPQKPEAGPPLIVMLGTFSAVHLAMGEARLPYDVARLANGADIGRQAVRAGYTAICVELSSLGERRERRYGRGTSTSTAAESALLFGHNLLGDRVSDLMCVVDWWRTDCGARHAPHQHPWVLGHSAGGTVALFGAAVDERIQGCVASGCIGFIRETLLKRRNDSGQNTVPGILNWLELDDVVSLVAPRPLLAVSGLQDHIWPFSGCEAVLAAARPMWDEVGDAAHIRASEAKGEHRFHPDATWDALRALRDSCA